MAQFENSACFCLCVNDTVRNVLNQLLIRYRKSTGQSRRALAKEIGIEHTALKRFEEGSSIESDKWVKLMMWVLIGPQQKQ